MKIPLVGWLAHAILPERYKQPSKPVDLPILLIASAYGRADWSEQLLKAGANVDLNNQLGETPLMIAAREGSLEVVEVLLKYGANINLVNNEGKTAYDLAEQAGHTEIMQAIASKIK